MPSAYIDPNLIQQARNAINPATGNPTGGNPAAGSSAYPGQQEYNQMVVDGYAAGPASPFVNGPMVPSPGSPAASAGGNTQQNGGGISYQPLPNNGGGAGGGFGGGGIADQQKANIEQRKANIITGANERYQGEVNALDSAEGLFRNEVGQNKNYVTQTRDMTIQGANQGAEDATRGARQNYLDSIVATRRRVRATGAGSSSAALELFNVLDRDLSSNMKSIESQKMGITGNAQLTAQRALNDLENSLNKFVADVQNKKDLSLRQKNEALRDAEMAAADAALQVDQWLNERMASSGAAAARGQASAEQGNILASYLRDINAPGANVQQIQQAYAPIFAQNGVDPSMAITYGQFGNAQPSALQEYTGMGGVPDEDIKFLLNYGLNQQKTANAGIPSIDQLYDPFTQQWNPLTSYYYPQEYQYAQGQSALQGAVTKLQSGNSAQLTPQEVTMLRAAGYAQ